MKSFVISQKNNEEMFDHAIGHFKMGIHLFYMHYCLNNPDPDAKLLIASLQEWVNNYTRYCEQDIILEPFRGGNRIVPGQNSSELLELFINKMKEDHV